MIHLIKIEELREKIELIPHNRLKFVAASMAQKVFVIFSLKNQEIISQVSYVLAKAVSMILSNPKKSIELSFEACYLMHHLDMVIVLKKDLENFITN